MSDIRDMFKDCLVLFTKEIYDGQYSSACRIHDAYGQEEHNCLGCNFAGSSDMVKRFLERHKTLNKVEDDCTMYILLLYLVVERIEVIMDIVKLPEPYKEKHFKVFQQIRKWANFIKHPGAFMLTHHAEYSYQENFTPLPDFIVIDDCFVRDHYTGHTDAGQRDKQRRALYDKLQNKQNVVVAFPDLVKLTKKFCYSYNKFVAVVADNEVYRGVLGDKTTTANYFSEPNAPRLDRAAALGRAESL